MSHPLREVCCASLPAASLAALAAVRDLAGVRVALADGRAWVRWQPPDDAILRAVLPVAGVQLFTQRDGRWYRHGRHLPAFDFPGDAEYRPLYEVLTPAPVQPVAPSGVLSQPVTLTLAVDARPRPVTAARCGLAELARWADTVPSARLESLRAACLGGRVLLLGTRLPPLIPCARFWGTTVLVPLGQRPEPDWPAAALREALDIADDELLLLTAAGAEAVPQTALQPLTRTRLRLALQEVAP
jgi:hypothetical protein